MSIYSPDELANLYADQQEYDRECEEIADDVSIFLRYDEPTEIELCCGKKVVAISVQIVASLFGSTYGHYSVGAITPDLKRVYADL